MILKTLIEWSLWFLLWFGISNLIAKILVQRDKIKFHVTIVELEKKLGESLDHHIETHENYQRIVGWHEEYANGLNEKIKQLEGEQNGK